jgi:hypothetical protein
MQTLRYPLAVLVILLSGAAGASAAVTIKNIRLSPTSPAMVRPYEGGTSGDRIEVVFDYESTEDFRFYGLYFHDGAATGVNSGSGLLAAGSGSGSGWLKLNRPLGETVDELFLYAVNSDFTRFLWWLRVPVHYKLGRNLVEVTGINVPSPAMLKVNEQVSVSFRTATDIAEGFRIWAYGLTASGASPPGMAFQGSTLVTGTGTLTRYFFSSLDSGDRPVGQVYVLIQNEDDQSDEDLTFPVDLRWGQTAFRQMVLTGHVWTDARYSFAVPYDTAEPTGIRPIPRPLVSRPEEVLVSGYSWGGTNALHGAGTYPNFINLDQGLNRAVRGIHFSVNRGSGETIDTILFPLPQPYHPDSPVRFRNVIVEPSVDGYLPTTLNDSSRRPVGVIPLGQRMGASFTAANQSGATYWLFVRPGVAGELVGGYGADGAFTIPSAPGETTGNRTFAMLSRSGPLTDLLFQVFPSGGSAPEYRILQPIDIAIDAPGPATVSSTSRTGNAFTVVWRGKAGYHARLLRSLDLVGWSPVTDWVRTFGSQTTFTDPVGATFQRAFFRVEMAAPLATPP